MSTAEKNIAALLERLFPITRSITGDGNRKTLEILREFIPLEIHEYPSGQKTFDWTIPDEWNISDAWIKNPAGEKVIDFKNSNLHVVGYSEPVQRKISREDLLPHLHYSEKLPTAIPYRTSYYKRDWGFCLSHDDFKNFLGQKGDYEIFIDSELKPGSLSVGELLLPGKSKKEYLLSTYICHPSLANDNLSGVVLTALLARELMDMNLNHSYRVVFCPETIGAVAYCFNNEAAMKAVEAGFVITSVGGQGKFGIKHSFDNSHYINIVAEQALGDCGIDDALHYPFDPHGSDERQYSSQAFRINTASICKDKYYEYDYYHTSLDDLEFVKPEAIARSLEVYRRAIEIIESNVFFRSLKPECEVMLSKHDLYPGTGGNWLPDSGGRTELDLILWLLFHCDGKTPLSKISRLLKSPTDRLMEIAIKLESSGILERTI